MNEKKKTRPVTYCQCIATFRRNAHTSRHLQQCTAIAWALAGCEKHDVTSRPTGLVSLSTHQRANTTETPRHSNWSTKVSRFLCTGGSIIPAGLRETCFPVSQRDGLPLTRHTDRNRRVYSSGQMSDGLDLPPPPTAMAQCRVERTRTFKGEPQFRVFPFLRRCGSGAIMETTHTHTRRISPAGPFLYAAHRMPYTFR